MVRCQKGMSLIELLTATAISAIMMAAVVVISKDVFSAVTKNSYEEHVSLIRQDIIRTLLNKKAWGHTVDNNQGVPVSGSLFCIKDASTTCSVTATGLIDVYGDNNQLFYESTQPTIGFTRMGQHCDTFSNYEPVSGCALKFNVIWRPVCVGTCTKPQVEVTGQLVVSTAAQSLFPYGTERHDFTLLIDQLDHYNPLAISNMIYVNQGDSANINVLENDVAENLAELTVVNVTTPASPGSTATIESDHTITYTPEPTFHGMDVFSYTIQDNWGGQSKAQVVVMVMTPFTWTGNAGTGIWHDGGNWCGPVVDGACQGAPNPPTNLDTAYFDSTCFRNCNSLIDSEIGNASTIGVRGIEISLGFGGTVSQAPGVLINIGQRGFIQESAVFEGADADIITSNFTLRGGAFNSTSAKLRIRGFTDINSSFFRIQNDYIPTFSHNNGTLEFFGYGNSLLEVQGLARLYDLLVTKDGGWSNLYMDGEIPVDHTLILNTSSRLMWTDGADTATIHLFGNLNAIRCNSGHGKIIIRGDNPTIDGEATGWLPSFEIASPGTVTVNRLQLGQNFRYTSGNVVFNAPVVEVGTDRASKLYPGDLRFPSVTFLGSASKVINGTLYVEGDFTTDHSNVYSGGGVVDVKGNVRAIHSKRGGTALVRLTGNQQTVTGSVGGYIPRLEFASTGSVTLNGDIEVGALLKYTSGGLNGQTSTIHLIGTDSKWINTGVAEFNSVMLKGTDSSTGLVGDFIIRNQLTVDMGQNFRSSTGNFVAYGDVMYKRAGSGVDSIGFVFKGGATQTFTHEGGTLPRGNWVVAKSGGTLRLGSNLNLGERTLTVKDGQTVDLSGHTLTINSPGQLILEGSATLSGGSFVGSCTGTNCGSW